MQDRIKTAEDEIKLIQKQLFGPNFVDTVKKQVDLVSVDKVTVLSYLKNQITTTHERAMESNKIAAESQ